MPQQGHESASPLPIYVAPSHHWVENKKVSMGHGVFAGQDFGIGEQMVRFERVLVGSLDTQRLSDTCAYCYLWTEGSSIGAGSYVAEGKKVQKCTGCQRFRYCSKICQRQAWKRGHKYECTSLRRVANREMPKAVLACMELLVRRKNGLVSDRDWEALCHLQDHVDDFKRNGTYERIELLAMGAREFSQTQDAFDKDFVVAMYARILTNCLTLTTPTLDPLGIALDPTIGHANHSCDPNAYIIMDGSQLSLRTLKSVQRDEEIYISYVDTTSPYRRRQSELQARWFFDCKCSKCQRGASLEDEWALGLGEMTERARKLADGMMKHEDRQEDSASYVGETKVEKRAAVIQQRVFAQYEEARHIVDDTKAIQTLEAAMQLCHESGIWSLHRQPYAALRDELIVRLLSKGRFSDAWSHCARRYKYILPVLYPVPFHPVRVIQVWQMAMLAAYMASTRDENQAPGVNMGLIAVILVRQILDISKFSHGLDNTFSRSIKAKAEEMMKEVERSIIALGRNVVDGEIEMQKEILVQMGDWAKI